jgi:hypothetical protein
MIDDQSEPGSWVREWDSRSHTSAEYRAEIRELRVRIIDYLSEIAQLRIELATEREKTKHLEMEP